MNPLRSWLARRRLARDFRDSVKIRAAQLRAVEAVEAQLAAGADWVIVEGRPIRREAAWAATQALRKAWELEVLYDGQKLGPDGSWWAKLEHPTTRESILIPLGFPPEKPEPLPDAAA